MALDDSKIPACDRCRSHKIKCDTADNTSKCAACLRGGYACIIFDPVSHERYTLEAIRELQRRLELLEGKATELDTNKSPASTTSPTSRTRRNHFVGDGSGLDLLTRVSQSQHWQHARSESLARPTVRSPTAQISDTPHELPPYTTAQTLVDRYFSHSHLHHPFMLRTDVLESLDRVYAPLISAANPQDLYRIFMVFAISSITLYRRGAITHSPYGFFNAASRFCSKIQMVGSITAIQNLLLIMRFAMYYHINCSIWDISRLCMRQCIELDLHRPPQAAMQPIQEQNSRNVFWDCYVHDRYSSGILGRPFAISEADISVDLPVEAAEEDITRSSTSSLDEIDLSNIKRPNEASVSLFVIGLRRITTRFQTRFFCAKQIRSPEARTITDAGKVQKDFNMFLAELQNWQASCPKIENPHSLYERVEWYEFLVEKDKLVLIRGAMANQPVAGLGPSKQLLAMCLACAARVIELYDDLYTRKLITWTRSYFQILFTSGLAIMHCMTLLHLDPTNDQTTIVSPEALHTVSALKMCSKLLQLLAQEMPDVSRFALVFDTLGRQFGLSGQERSTRSDGPTSLQSQNDRVHGENQNTTVSTSNMHSTQTNINEITNDSSTISRQPTSVDLPQPAIPSFPTTQPNPYNLEENNIYNLGLNLDFNNFQDWPLFSYQDNVLGQMEAGLGEYAWGQVADDSNWYQYFCNG